MGVTGCTRVIKWIFIIFNVLVLCAGAVAIGLGAWGLGSQYGAEKLRDLTGSEIYRGAAIAIIVGGSILAAISFIGALGAIIENRWLLGLYFVIMLLLLILFVTAAAVGFAFRDKIEDELSKQMEQSLLYMYGNDIDNNDRNYDTTNVWDEVQSGLECCGVKGGVNDTKSWFLWQSSTWFEQQAVPLFYVPTSCCVSQKENTTCQSINLQYPTQPIQTSLTLVRDPNPALYNEGCIDRLEDFIYEHIIAIGGIAIAILIVMLLCLLMSVCICTNIRKSKRIDEKL